MLFDREPSVQTLFVVRPKEGGEPVVLLVLRPGQFGGEHSRLCLPSFGGRSRSGGQTEDQAIRDLFGLAPVDPSATYDEPKLTDAIWPGGRLVSDSGAAACIRLEEIELPADLLVPHAIDLDDYHEYSGGSYDVPVICAVRVSQLPRVSDPLAIAALILYQSRPASSPG